MPQAENIQLLKDGKELVFKIKNGTSSMPVFESFKTQVKFSQNGAPMLENPMKNDSGDYVLMTFDADGKMVKTVAVHLEIQGIYGTKNTLCFVCLSVVLNIIGSRITVNLK